MENNILVTLQNKDGEIEVYIKEEDSILVMAHLKPIIKALFESLIEKFGVRKTLRLMQLITDEVIEEIAESKAGDTVQKLMGKLGLKL